MFRTLSEAVINDEWMICDAAPEADKVSAVFVEAVVMIRATDNVCIRAINVHDKDI